MLLKLEGFQYAKQLDLNIGYYHIRLIKKASKLCTIIIPWGNIITNVYQWEFLIPQKFSNGRGMIYFMDLNLSVRTYMTF